MPSIDQMLREGAQILKEAGIPSPLFDARELLMHALNLPSRTELYQTGEAGEKEEENFHRLILKRAKRYPLQYLLGFWEFYGRRFVVREGVLIPRADTECLVDCALQVIDETAAGPVLDLCSGTGAIAITLALEREAAQIDALEFSPTALGVLQENIQMHAALVRTLAADVFSYIPDRAYSLITCNPPYISEKEYPCLQPEVLYEPQMALVAGHNGLMFYEEITRRYQGFLLPGGVLLFEIGAGQAEAVKSLLAHEGYQKIFSRRDIQGIERVIGGYKT